MTSSSSIGINFPGFEPELVLQTVNDLRNEETVTKTISSVVAVTGNLAFNDGKGSLYVWDPTNVQPDDGVLIIEPNNAPIGRWVSILSTASKAYVDSSILAVNTFNRSGTTTTRTIDSKMADFINVKDFGAVGDKVTDDYPAFAAAFAACNAGGTIYVPSNVTGYNLSANPDTRTKYVNWYFDGQIQFTGLGSKTAITAGGGLFATPQTNPYIQIFGQQNQIDLSKNTTANGGCLIGESWELKDDYGYAVTFTGTVTNGSPTITAISSVAGGTLTQLNIGDRIVSSVAGWPTGPYYLVYSVNASANTVTFGIDAGAGPGGTTNFTGTTATGTFTVYKKQWFALHYRGTNTGGPNSVAMAYGIDNDVMNITGGPGNVYEIDMNLYVTPANICRAIFLTGGGASFPGANIVAIDIQRAGQTPWNVAMSVRSATTGVLVNAKNPISIDTAYGNPLTGAAEPVNYGIHLNNSPAVRGAVLEGRQITDNSQALVLWRFTDTTPGIGGRYIQCMNAANNTELFFVDIYGGVHANAPSNTNGSTTASGSFYANGITMTAATNIQLGNAATTATKAATGKYISLVDSTGATIYLQTYA